ncbi:MAG: dipeptidase [Acidobacteriota bacterium]
MNEVIRYIEENRERYLDELNQFLRIPSISTDSSKKEDVWQAAEFVADQLRRAGMQRVNIFPTEGHPIVYGERIEKPDSPTLLVYGHYDVQPVDPVELWQSGPFEPTVRNGELYARGAVDDKGQVFIHFKSAEAFIASRKELPINLKYLIEGEEEIGSPHLDSFIQENRDLLKADTVMISDTAMFARGIPSICYGLRGLVYFQIDVQGPRQDLHSGSFGGPVANPAFVLSEILAAMKDEKGRITIPHFYDDVRSLSQREREEFASLPFDQMSYQKDLDVDALNGEEGFTPLEQLWARPTFEVNGLLSGFTGEGAKTVLPAKAMAKVSMRLVPDQKPAKVEEEFERYVAELVPASVKVEVKRMQGGKAWVASLDHPALQAAAAAIERGFGKRPVFQREGGSIPVVSTFSELLGIPSVLMGIGLPDENAHAPNEKLDLGNFYRGIKSSAYFMDELSKLPRHLK